MSRAKYFSFLLILIFLSCQQNKTPLRAQKSGAEPAVQRIDGSPYPASQIPDTLFVVDEGHFSPDQRLVIETLQGVLAQKKPAIYRRISRGYTIWLSDLEERFGVTIDHSFETDFSGLLRHFKSQISGYILCNARDASTNVALSLCGIRRAIAVTPDIQPDIEALGIPYLLNVRGWTINDLLQKYGREFNNRIVSFQDPDKYLNLGDYAVFSRAITFFSREGDETFDRVLGRSSLGGALLGWGHDEFQLVSESSKRGFWVHAADWSLNLSTLTNFNVELHQKESPDSAVISKENVHTVCFLMTDGDNVQWLLNDFDTEWQWYGSPLRGKVPLGWGVSPAMAELAPTVLSRFYRDAADTTTGRDYFVAASSGLGYMYPERFPDLAQFAQLTAAFMKKADLRIVNIIGNDSSRTFLAPYLEQEQIDAVFYYAFSNYSKGKGAIHWINGKPVIFGRYNLWKGFETPLSLAQKLNRLPRDARSPNGYSLIPAHVWSKGVPEVVSCANRLQPDVLVVTPDIFVKRILHFLKPESSP